MPFFINQVGAFDVSNTLDKGSIRLQYNLDVSALSLEEYKKILKRQNLLPGRRILWQNIDQNFEIIGKQNVHNIAVLKKLLSTPQKLTSFATVTGISEAYLIILKREIGSLEQKPVSITSFPGVDDEVISKLKSKGIVNSKEYYESEQNFSVELFCLCDLVRINGVGAVAAKTLYEAGYQTIADVASSDATVMLEKMTKVNELKGYYKAKLGVKDMQFCIDFALLLIKYSK